jgi:hypothetical protein
MDRNYSPNSGATGFVYKYACLGIKFTFDFNECFDGLRIHVVGDRIDIYKKGSCSDPGYTAGRRKKRIGNGDNSVPRPNALDHQGNEQGISPRRHPYPILAATIGSYSLF